MKHTILLIAFMAGLGLSCIAQQKRERNQPVNGYWVIETSKKLPKQSIVYFYTNANQLVYKELVNGRKLNVSRQKICRRLNSVLQQSILAWQTNKTLKENQQLVQRH